MSTKQTTLENSEKKETAIIVIRELGNIGDLRAYHIARVSEKNGKDKYANYILQTSKTLEKNGMYNIIYEGYDDTYIFANDKYEPKYVSDAEASKFVDEDFMEKIEENIDITKPKTITNKEIVRPVEPSDADINQMVQHEEEEKARRIQTISASMVVPKESNLELTPENVKEYLCPMATNQEIHMFMQLCIHQGLNPFIGDAYLIKYGKNDSAKMIVGKYAFIKKAESIPEYRGFKAGVMTTDGETIFEREGEFVPPNEELVGGWCEVFRDGYENARARVSLEEYDVGNPIWKKKPATMIRKVAIVHALREAFTHAFQGMYDASEMGVYDQNMEEDAR